MWRSPYDVLDDVLAVSGTAVSLVRRRRSPGCTWPHHAAPCALKVHQLT
jgi:hypothetical protein